MPALKLTCARSTGTACRGARTGSSGAAHPCQSCCHKLQQCRGSSEPCQRGSAGVMGLARRIPYAVRSSCAGSSARYVEAAYTAFLLLTLAGGPAPFCPLYNVSGVLVAHDCSSATAAAAFPFGKFSAARAGEPAHSKPGRTSAIELSREMTAAGQQPKRGSDTAVAANASGRSNADGPAPAARRRHHARNGRCQRHKHERHDPPPRFAAFCRPVRQRAARVPAFLTARFTASQLEPLTCDVLPRGSRGERQGGHRGFTGEMLEMALHFEQLRLVTLYYM